MYLGIQALLLMMAFHSPATIDSIPTLWLHVPYHTSYIHRQPIRIHAGPEGSCIAQRSKYDCESEACHLSSKELGSLLGLKGCQGRETYASVAHDC